MIDDYDSQWACSRIVPLEVAAKEMYGIIEESERGDLMLSGSGISTGIARIADTRMPGSAVLRAARNAYTFRRRVRGSSAIGR